jgi:hypothetical protein
MRMVGNQHLWRLGVFRATTPHREWYHFTLMVSRTLLGASFLALELYIFLGGSERAKLCTTNPSYILTAGLSQRNILTARTLIGCWQRLVTASRCFRPSVVFLDQRDERVHLSGTHRRGPISWLRTWSRATPVGLSYRMKLNDSLCVLFYFFPKEL